MARIFARGATSQHLDSSVRHLGEHQHAVHSGGCRDVAALSLNPFGDLFTPCQADRAPTRCAGPDDQLQGLSDR